MGIRGHKYVVNLYTVEYSGSRPTEGGSKGYYPEAPKLVSRNRGPTRLLIYFYFLGCIFTLFLFLSSSGPEGVQLNNCMACFVQTTIVFTLSLSKYFIGGTAEYKQPYTPVCKIVE